MTAAGPVAAPAFVVRTQSQWWITSSWSSPRLASLDEVVALIGHDTSARWLIRSGPAAAPRQPRPGEPTDHVAPTPTWVGVVGAGHIVVDDAHGGTVLLGEADLCLLDALEQETSVSELTLPVVCEPRAERIGRLIAAGLARAVGPVPRAEPVEVVPSLPSDAMSPHRRTRSLGRRIREAYLLSSKLEPVRRAIAERRDHSAASDETHPAPTTQPADLDRRTVVYAPWHADHGPLLALGMLTAAARHHDDGRLDAKFEIRRPEEAGEALAHLARGRGPAILLCSDYVWSIDQNIALAREAVARRPEVLVIHGGPSSPRYEADAEHFLETYGDVAHVLVRGEGEDTFCELLDALAEDPTVSAGNLAVVAGITFRDPATGEIVRTPDRPRIVDLDRLPSPYLTGEFDDIAAEAWTTTGAVETNRGCPYGCTFCDWGSAINSRIRMFDMDRVKAEVTWIGERGLHCMMLTDANFGITSRDVDTAKWIARVRDRTDHPDVLAWMAAKNTTKHLTKIFDALLPSGIVSNVSLSLQTFDEATLAAIDRSNISSEHFVKLATDLRHRGVPLQSDLMLGLPGQTYQSYRSDLQVMFDLEILPRTWPVQQLPNSPMNDPAYRDRYAIRTDERNIVVSTSTYDEADRRRMVRLRRLFTTTEVFGLLRHLLRWMQWDHDLVATDVMDAILTAADDEPERYPLLAWVVENFDLYPVAPVGWASFYLEVRRFLVDRYPILDDDVAFDCVLALQEMLMPAAGRQFPSTIELEHDYLAYYLGATESLFTSGQAGTPAKALRDHGPAPFTVRSDPLGLCTEGVTLLGDSRDEQDQGDFYLVSASAYELDSPLVRLLPHVLREFPKATLDRVRALRPPRPSEAGIVPESVPLSLGRTVRPTGGS